MVEVKGPPTGEDSMLSWLWLTMVRQCVGDGALGRFWGCRLHCATLLLLLSAGRAIVVAASDGFFGVGQLVEHEWLRICMGRLCTGTSAPDHRS